MKKSSASNTPLQPGQICGFFEKEAFHFGIIFSAADQSYRVMSDDGLEYCFNAGRLVVVSDECYSLADIALTLTQFIAEVSLCRKNVNLEQLWRKLKPSQIPRSLQAMTAEAGSAGDAGRFALYLALRDNPAFFSVKDGMYQARSEEAMTLHEQARLKQLLDAAYHREIEAWVKLLPEAQSAQSSNAARVLNPATKQRLIRDLSSFYYDRLPSFLLKICRQVCPGKTQLECSLLIRKGLGQYDEQTPPLLAHSGLPCLFSEELLAHAAAIADFVPGTSRHDLRSHICFTIDASETQDLDDAISFEQTPEGWLLGVHVSDVSSFIPPGSPPDREAYLRTSSIYLPDCDVHMLPPVISCHKASLRLDKDRPALSLLVQVDNNFKLGECELLASTVRVSGRFSYEETEQRLQEKGNDDFFANALKNLQKLTEKHIQQRLDQGAIIIPDEDSQKPARRLVAECMVIYNKLLAQLAAQHGIPLFYRHLGQTSAELDITEGAFIPPAVLGTYPHKHIAMGLDVYAQATSPLRRYADLVNQRQLKAFLNKESLPYSTADLQGMLEHLSTVRQMIRQVNRAQSVSVT